MDESKPFFLIGGICIIAGGLVAAVTRPLNFDDGSWLAAYLVLVGGVAQIALGYGQATLSRTTPEPKLVTRELVTWNVGSAVVIAGSLTASALLTSIGGVVLAVALWSFLVGVRNIAPSVHGGLIVLYRGLATFVLLSIPVGLVISWIRHG